MRKKITNIEINSNQWLYWIYIYVRKISTVRSSKIKYKDWDDQKEKDYDSGIGVLEGAPENWYSSWCSVNFPRQVTYLEITIGIRRFSGAIQQTLDMSDKNSLNCFTDIQKYSKSQEQFMKHSIDREIFYKI